MRYGVTKKLLVGALAATFLLLQVPATALAATDEEALAAADAGIEYLAETQADDGSIPGGIGGETDWAIIAVEASGQDAEEFENGNGTTAVDFIETEATTDATDVARRMLAIASTEGDSTDFGGTDYNALLATYHVNDQVGDEAFLNDDTFAILAIKTSGDESLYEIAQDSLDALLANQGLDGSFSGGTAACAWCVANSNDTATAIIAMKSATAMGLVNVNLDTAQASALTFLLSLQREDGGFIFSPVYDSPDFPAPSDGSSTSWALMALNAIGAGVETQAMAARDWLLANQNDDGGFSYGAFGLTDSDTFSTAHAVTALRGTTWLLDPTPLVAQVPEEETPSEEEEEVTPVVTTVAEDDEQTPPAEEATETQPEVLMTTTSAPVEEPQPKVEENKPAAVTPAAAKTPYTQYAIYAVIILGALLLGWYAFRPKADK